MSMNDSLRRKSQRRPTWLSGGFCATRPGNPASISLGRYIGRVRHIMMPAVLSGLPAFQACWIRFAALSANIPVIRPRNCIAYDESIRRGSARG
jgi:hypothetical protein